MVMEFREHDLKALMETMPKPFTIPEVKCVMRQLASGRVPPRKRSCTGT